MQPLTPNSSFMIVPRYKALLFLFRLKAYYYFELTYYYSYYPIEIADAVSLFYRDRRSRIYLLLSRVRQLLASTFIYTDGRGLHKAGPSRNLLIVFVGVLERDDRAEHAVPDEHDGEEDTETVLYV